MVKLRELLDESIDSVNIFSESPMKVGNWDYEWISNPSKNYTFTIGIKEKGKNIGKFDKYDIFELPWKKEIINCFVSNDFTDAFFQYKPLKNNYIEITNVWQNITATGLNRKITFDYYLQKYNGIVLTEMTTDFGEKNIKKILKQAKELNYKVSVLVDDKDKISLNNIDDADKYYLYTPKGLKYKFIIEK